MIRLKRDRATGRIHENFFGEKKSAFERELIEDHRKLLDGKLKKHNFRSERWKTAKAQLIVETGGKCAYCEAPTSLVAYGDVEHYRPKSKYWWLAYCYDNFLVSCQLCNQKYKKAKFPVKKDPLSEPNVDSVPPIAPDPTDEEAIERFVMAQFDERPLLVNPYYEDPEIYFAWRPDEVLEEVELIPLLPDPEVIDICQAAIDNYGLNRKFLRDARWDRYQLYMTFRTVLTDEGISEATKMVVNAQIDEMKGTEAPFAGMIRYFDRFRG